MNAPDAQEAAIRRQEAAKWLAIVEEDIDIAVAAIKLTPPRAGYAWGVAYRYPALDGEPEPEPSLAELEMAAETIRDLSKQTMLLVGGK